MASDLENSIREAVNKLASALNDAAELKVQTSYVEVGADGKVDLAFENAKPAALTVISLDGDHKAVVPVTKNANGTISIDSELLELHSRNVASAIQYRASIVNALLGLLEPKSR